MTRCLGLRDIEYCNELQSTTKVDWYMLKVTVPMLSRALHSVLPTVRNESNTLLHMTPKTRVKLYKRMHARIGHLCRRRMGRHASKTGST